jgi:hypothetical protein
MRVLTGFLAALWIIFGCCPAARALDFQVEKQKLKLSLEYETFVGLQSGKAGLAELRAPGLKTTYLLRAQAGGKRASLHLDFQTGLKVNVNSPDIDISRAIWSNRLQATLVIPCRSVYFSGSFYFRNKMLSDSAFVDIFGGQGFREGMGSLQVGWVLPRSWQLSVSVRKSSLVFDRFTLSNSEWSGASARLSHRVGDVNVFADYRVRSIDYKRPVIRPEPLVWTATTDMQHDRLSEAAVGMEFSRRIYVSAGYVYQNNLSNNPGFSFRNHRVNVLLGSELGRGFHLQAYGIVQMLDFSTENAPLLYPILFEENENDTMAASLTRSLGERSEIEFGFQRLTSHSSFASLNASKYVLYLAHNFRF